ncbi:MAG: hypothetical protein ABIM59_04055 [candidate division WOR-3 bacterium]
MISLRARIPYAMATKRDGEPGRLEPFLNLSTSTRRSILKVRTRSGRLMSVYDQPQRPLKRLLPYLPEETAKELLELRQRLKPLDPWFGDLEF